MTDDPVLSLQDVASELHLSRRTLERYLRDSVIRGVKRGGRWYIRRSAVNAFLDPDVQDSVR
jgi:excisionase family DNA binding protein